MIRLGTNPLATHRRRPWMRAALLTVTLALGLLAAPSGASANELVVTDPGGGGTSAYDLRKVKIVNDAKGVRITVRTAAVDWSRPTPLGELTLLLDTEASSPGAEFVESVGIPGDGGFFAVKGSAKHRRSWVTYPFPGRCGKSVRERYGLENGKITIRIKPKKGCLRHPECVRVNVRTVQTTRLVDGRHVETRLADHLPYKNTFTPWVTYSAR